METRGAQTEGSRPIPPPPPPGTRRPGASLRVAGVLGFLVLAFGAAVLCVAAADIGGTPTCADVQAGKASLPGDRKCFDGGSTKKTATLVLLWPGAVLAGLAALLSLIFAFTVRDGRRVLMIAALAIILAGLGILIGSV